MAVAFSGGADSTALLHAACALQAGEVVALHVHHGLQAAADEFERVCGETCAALDVVLKVSRVDARGEPGESPEDAARKSRYRALAKAAKESGVGLVLLGQHADDQVETMLLALSRGAGPAGLAGMRPSFEIEGIRFMRPLLDIPAHELRTWLLEHGHGFIDDPTNRHEQFTRNRIRARLLPALDAAFPQFRQTFARSARHAAQATQLLAEVASQDLLQTGTPPAVAVLQTLSAARQANVLRFWLLSRHQATPSTAQLDELLGQISACTTRGHRIDLKVAAGQVSLQDGHLLYAAKG
ncbi:MAG: tRNA lysidine(34) synthetase TilS [Pseudomonadota bacterium]